MDGTMYYLVDPHGRAGIEYRQACAAEWIKRFGVSENRIDAWKS
jgi:hypothetical protein